MNTKKITLAVLFLFCVPRLLMAQLVSEIKPANELLIDSLLTLDELSETYCARFQGEMSELKKDIPSLQNISGYSVKAFPPERSCFHSWGFFHVLGGTPMRNMSWSDALRVGANGKLFKMGQQVDQPSTPNLEIESEENLRKNPNAVWQYPELDPFGLVFAVEGALTRNNSDFSKTRDNLLRAELLESKNLENGNVVGIWKFPAGKTRLTCEFDRKSSYMPTYVHVQMHDEKTGKKGQVLGATRTRWQKYGNKALVPERTTITADRESGAKLEVSMNWEWLPLDVWERTKFDWTAHLQNRLGNLRKPFADLIEKSLVAEPPPSRR